MGPASKSNFCQYFQCVIKGNLIDFEIGKNETLSSPFNALKHWGSTSQVGYWASHCGPNSYCFLEKNHVKVPASPARGRRQRPEPLNIYIYIYIYIYVCICMYLYLGTGYCIIINLIRSYGYPSQVNLYTLGNQFHGWLEIHLFITTIFFTHWPKEV